MLRLVALLFLAGCAGGAPPPDWRLNAVASLRIFQRHDLTGDTKSAEAEFLRARDEIRRTGRGDILARAELVRCATRAASLELTTALIPGVARRSGCGRARLCEFLAGRGERVASDDPLSRLVASGVQFRAGKISPAQISAAAETASAQGWRRPLLAWLGVQAKRAEAAGDAEGLRSIRRRIELIGLD